MDYLYVIFALMTQLKKEILPGRIISKYPPAPPFTGWMVCARHFLIRPAGPRRAAATPINGGASCCYRPHIWQFRKTRR